MKLNLKKGFTLIELLVVVAIIGILASVVLASLNSARTKGTDAAIKANLANARAQAELFYDGAGLNTYTGVCQTGAGTIYAAISAASTAAGTSANVVFSSVAQTTSTANCQSSPTAWAASVKLKTGALYQCVDSTGASKETTLLPASTTVCP